LRRQARADRALSGPCSRSCATIARRSGSASAPVTVNSTNLDEWDAFRDRSTPTPRPAPDQVPSASTNEPVPREHSAGPLFNRAASAARRRRGALRPRLGPNDFRLDLPADSRRARAPAVGRCGARHDGRPPKRPRGRRLGASVEVRHVDEAHLTVYNRGPSLGGRCSSRSCAAAARVRSPAWLAIVGCRSSRLGKRILPDQARHGDGRRVSREPAGSRGRLSATVTD